MGQNIYNVVLFEWQVSSKFMLVTTPTKMQGQLKIRSYYICCFKEKNNSKEVRLLTNSAALDITI